MAKPLVIVESPAKARTISRFLGGDFVVESSIGHVRDLPRNAAEVPASHKGEGWARLGVDIDDKALQVNNIADVEDGERRVAAGLLDRRFGLFHRLACAADQKDVRALASE